MLHIKCTYTLKQILCQTYLKKHIMLIINNINFMKKSFIFFTIALISISCSDNELSKEDITIDMDNLYDCDLIADFDGIRHLNSDKFNGSCALYSKGQIQEIQSYIDGIGDGMHVGYYLPEETIDYIGYKKNGEIDGKFTKFHPNGNIAVTGKFIQGRYTGKFNYYDNNGILYETKKYDKYGVLLNTKSYD
jgi:hypothetical protein